MIHWLETHDKLAGWAQFAGAIMALGLTYFTAFMPIWRRKRQLEASGKRLLANSFEALESAHHTLGHFIPYSINLRAAAVPMLSISEEISKFPIYELDDQGSRSVARNLIALNVQLAGTRLMLDAMAVDIEGRPANVDERNTIGEFLRERVNLARDILSGADLKRPDWPGTASTEGELHTQRH